MYFQRVSMQENRDTVKWDMELSDGYFKKARIRLVTGNAAEAEVTRACIKFLKTANAAHAARVWKSPRPEASIREARDLFQLPLRTKIPL
jgi:hypothetical protein